MPARRSSLSRNWLLIVVGVLAIAGFVASYFLVFQTQEIRQQAAGCSEAPVNVEFRKYTGKDEPGWKSDLNNVFPGDKLDVNCFAKNGTALLKNGKFTATLNGKPYTIPKAAFKSPTEIRGWKIPQEGKYVFTCSNGAGCKDSDDIVIPKRPTRPTPTPTPTPPTSPTPTPVVCVPPHVADLNHDCLVDIRDFDLFLKDFLANQ